MGEHNFSHEATPKLSEDSSFILGLRDSAVTQPGTKRYTVPLEGISKKRQQKDKLQKKF